MTRFYVDIYDWSQLGPRSFCVKVRGIAMSDPPARKPPEGKREANNVIAGPFDTQALAQEECDYLNDLEAKGEVPASRP